MSWALYDKKTKELTIFEDGQNHGTLFKDVNYIEGWDEKAEQDFMLVMEEEMISPCSFQQRIARIVGQGPPNPDFEEDMGT